MIPDARLLERKREEISKRASQQYRDAIETILPAEHLQGVRQLLRTPAGRALCAYLLRTHVLADATGETAPEQDQRLGAQRLAREILALGGFNEDEMAKAITNERTGE